LALQTKAWRLGSGEQLSEPSRRHNLRSLFWRALSSPQARTQNNARAL
jgi:hypothetical protein